VGMGMKFITVSFSNCDDWASALSNRRNTLSVCFKLECERLMGHRKNLIEIRS